jgi:hypothetical protein
MAAKTTKAPARTGRAGKEKEPRLIKMREVAAMLGITTQNIRRWVANGSWPEPHSAVATTWLYRADHIKTFVETGKWPDGVKFKRRRGGEE